MITQIKPVKIMITLIKPVRIMITKIKPVRIMITQDKTYDPTGLESIVKTLTAAPMDM